MPDKKKRYGNGVVPPSTSNNNKESTAFRGVVMPYREGPPPSMSNPTNVRPPLGLIGAGSSSPIAKNRRRADSNGSTRGAFDPLPHYNPTDMVESRYHQPPPPPPDSLILTAVSGKKKKRHKKKRSSVNPQLSSPPGVDNIDMSNIASLAMTGVDDDDLIIPPSNDPIQYNQRMHHELKQQQQNDNFHPSRVPRSPKMSPRQQYRKNRVDRHFQSRNNDNSRLALDGSSDFSLGFDANQPKGRNDYFMSSSNMSLEGGRPVATTAASNNVGTNNHHNSTTYGSAMTATSSINNSHRRHRSTAEEQRAEMNIFSSMASGELPLVGTNATEDVAKPPRRPAPPQLNYQYSDDSLERHQPSSAPPPPPAPSSHLLLEKNDVKKNEEKEIDEVKAFQENCTSYSDLLEYTFVKHYLYNKYNPEFTSLQQFVWALLIGIFMGVYTALWKFLIEFVVEFMWETVPEYLFEEVGLFTELDGSFPLTYWMWICPTICSGILSYIFAILKTPIPGQNEWIQSLHKKGTQDSETFLTLFILSTAGMSTGLSLGPELPLVLTGGMFGSHIATITRQSVISARAINITAASAAVSGFFGFPMAGALFVLEVPHRMGLQYFEALSPATIASIVAVIVNRLIVQNDVTGYFKYPFLSSTLPSSIFYISIAYGMFGSALGIFYVAAVKKLKGGVHDLFHSHSPHHDDDQDDDVKKDEQEQHKLNGNFDVPDGKDGFNEHSPLVKTEVNTSSNEGSTASNSNGSSCMASIGSIVNKVFSFGIEHEPTRAGVAGSLAGLAVGIICMFVPHVMFWGEEQIQNLIDKGRTPLPVFGHGNETTSDLTAYGFCMIDPDDSEAVAKGFSISCAAAIALAKIAVTGLSLGTGIIGGHFWGPLFVGCAASHLFTDLMVVLTNWFPGDIGNALAEYPCVAILCIMGSTHIVTFRAHMAITLILTLTISSFSDADGKMNAGDYSAVFPLLVISCFVSLMFTRDHIFYAEQRCRGDIMASPEVLCEPGKEGRPHVVGWEYDDVDGYEDGDETDNFDSTDYSNFTEEAVSSRLKREEKTITQDDIESAFEMINKKENSSTKIEKSILEKDISQGTVVSTEIEDRIAMILATPLESNRKTSTKNNNHRKVASLAPSSLRVPAQETITGPPPSHRRTNTIGGGVRKPSHRRTNSDASTQSVRSRSRINSYGEVTDFYPNLFDQARQQAATRRSVQPPPRAASKPTASGTSSGRHSRSSSNSSIRLNIKQPLKDVVHKASALLSDLKIDP